jgi:hypothetical protein
MTSNRANERPGPFNEADALRQNQEWMARRAAEKARRQAIQRAIWELRGRTAEEQLAWYDQQGDDELADTVSRYFLPEARSELLRRETERLDRWAVEQERRDKARPRQRTIADAEGFLRRLLARGRRVPAKQILTKARNHHISERTLNRAKASLRIRSERVGFGAGGHFVWFLPSRRI